MNRILTGLTYVGMGIAWLAGQVAEFVAEVLMMDWLDGLF